MKLFLTMKKGLGDLCAALWYNWLFLILKRQYKRTINIDKQVVVPCKRRIKEPIGRLINLCLSQKQFFHRLSKITQPCALRSRESCKYVNLRRCVRVTSWGEGGGWVRFILPFTISAVWTWSKDREEKLIHRQTG